MAEPDGSGDSDTFGFLTRKVGPMPIWLWGVIAVAAYYGYTHFIKKPSSSAPKQQTAPTNTERVVSSGGPTIETVHISHERPSHKRH